MLSHVISKSATIATVILSLLLTLSPIASADQIRLSTAGGLGDDSFGTEDPAVSFNSTRNEFLVVWEADDNVNGQVAGEHEIIGRRVSAVTGQPLGSEFRITHWGPSGDPSFDAGDPDLAYNPDLDQYLLVFRAKEEFEAEIYGLVLDGTGAPDGSAVRLSQMGPDGEYQWQAISPAVVYNPNWHEYLVLWSGSDDFGGRVASETEIYAQRVSVLGEEAGQDDIWISDMGPTGDRDFDAENPDLVYDPIRDRYMAIWSADDDTSGQIDGEFEVFGQLLHGQSGAPLLGAQIRYSSLGGLGNTDLQARQPEIAFNPVDSEFLLMWRTCEIAWSNCLLTSQRVDALNGQEVGIDDRIYSGAAADERLSVGYSASSGEYIVAHGATDDEPPVGIGQEVFTSRLSNEGEPVGGPTRRSFHGIGPGGTYEAQYPTLAVDSSTGSFMVAWAGDHNAEGQVDDEYETFGVFVGPEVFADDFESGNLSGWSLIVD